MDIVGNVLPQLAVRRKRARGSGERVGGGVGAPGDFGILGHSQIIAGRCLQRAAPVGRRRVVHSGAIGGGGDDPALPIIVWAPVIMLGHNTGLRLAKRTMVMSVRASVVFMHQLPPKLLCGR